MLFSNAEAFRFNFQLFKHDPLPFGLSVARLSSPVREVSMDEDKTRKRNQGGRIRGNGSAFKWRRNAYDAN